MFRSIARFILLAVTTFFAPASGPAYWSFHREMDRSWEEVSQSEVDDAIYSLPTHYAYTVFYVQSGGSNANSGSTTGAVVYTTANGTWVNAANTYTPTDGSTPASTVAVNDYVNIGGSYVAQVTAVGAGVNGVITVSSTIIYGTNPANSSVLTLNDGGPWADLTGIPTISFTIPQSTQVCVKHGATLGGAAAQTFAMGGSISTKPLWYRGYNTTVGDLDMPSATLTYPTMPYTSTGQATFSGAATELSGFNITASVNNRVLTMSGSNYLVHNCTVSNATNNTSAGAFAASANAGAITCCYLSVVGNAAVIVGASGQGLVVDSCTLIGNSTGSGQHGLSGGGTQASVHFHRCTLMNLGGNGIYIQGNGSLNVISNTFSNCGGSGVNLSQAPSSGSIGLIANNYFYKSGAYDINNSSGTNTDVVQIINNVHNQPTSGQITGFGDRAEINPLTESLTPPFVSSTDLHLLSTSVGASAGLPGQWENQAAGLVSTPDVGAWQRNASTGGGTPAVWLWTGS